MATKESLLRGVINKEKLEYAKQIKECLIKNNIKGVKELLKKFSSDDKYVLNTPLDGAGWCVLHFAAANYSREVVDALIKKGADPTKKNNEGNTCLHLLFTSTKYLDKNLKQTFLEKNADSKLQKQEAEQRVEIIKLMPAAVFHLGNSKKETALDLALKQERKFAEEIELLRNEGKVKNVLPSLPKVSVESPKSTATVPPAKYSVPSKTSRYPGEFFLQISQNSSQNRGRSNTVSSDTTSGTKVDSVNPQPQQFKLAQASIVTATKVGEVILPDKPVFQRFKKP